MKRHVKKIYLSNDDSNDISAFCSDYCTHVNKASCPHIDWCEYDYQSNCDTSDICGVDLS